MQAPPSSGSARPSLRIPGASWLAWLLLAALLGYGLVQVRLYLQKAAHTEALAQQTTIRMEAQLAGIAPLTTAEKQALRSQLNPVHLRHARRLGIERIEDRSEAERLIRQNQLVPLDGTAYFSVAPMHYSVPAVTENTAHLMTLIGQRFHAALDTAGLPPFRFRITSATRSREDQRALRRFNVNAARQSAHEYGTTVDVHYGRFDLEPDAVAVPDSADILTDRYRQHVTETTNELARRRHQQLKAVLGRVLLDLQQEGKVAVIYERRQPVYHLTVADRLGPPEPDLAHEPSPATHTPAARRGPSTRYPRVFRMSHRPSGGTMRQAWTPMAASGGRL